VLRFSFLHMAYTILARNQSHRLAISRFVRTSPPQITLRPSKGVHTTIEMVHRSGQPKKNFYPVFLEVFSLPAFISGLGFRSKNYLEWLPKLSTSPVRNCTYTTRRKAYGCYIAHEGGGGARLALCIAPHRVAMYYSCCCCSRINNIMVVLFCLQ